MNRMEICLNYKVEDTSKFFTMRVWDDDLVNFPRDPFVLDYGGTVVAGSGFHWGTLDFRPRQTI
jgi:hypothetical protein